MLVRSWLRLSCRLSTSKAMVLMFIAAQVRGGEQAVGLFLPWVLTRKEARSWVCILRMPQRERTEPVILRPRIYRVLYTSFNTTINIRITTCRYIVNPSTAEHCVCV